MLFVGSGLLRTFSSLRVFKDLMLAVVTVKVQTHWWFIAELVGVMWCTEQQHQVARLGKEWQQDESQHTC